MVSPTVPVPISPVRAISTEHTYAAFPAAARSKLGTAIVAYRVGLGHVPAGGMVRVRRQPVGAAWWSAPINVVAPAPNGSGWGTTGIAVEKTGGRIWLGLRKYHRTSVTTTDQDSAHVIWSDDDGLTWSSPVALPTATLGDTFGAGMLWLPNGTLLATVYHGATIPRDVRVYASTDRGATWITRADVNLGTRTADEPGMVLLADGRVGMVLRSDGVPIPGADPPKNYYAYMYTTVSADSGATWSTPVQAVWHGTGGPTLHLLADDRIAVVYRGQSEPVNTPVASQPTRVGILGPDLTRLEAGGELLQQQIDVVSGDSRRHMYGQILPGWAGSPDRLVWSAENTPQSSDYATATLYERELEWR